MGAGVLIGRRRVEEPKTMKYSRVGLNKSVLVKLLMHRNETIITSADKIYTSYVSSTSSHVQILMMIGLMVAWGGVINFRLIP